MPTTPSPIDDHSIDEITSIVDGERLSLERHSRLRFIHWFLVLLSVLLTVAVWNYVRNQVALRTQARFDAAAVHVTDLIKDRLEKYELALWSGVATLKTRDNTVDLNTWRTFSQTLRIESRYRGINGIGVIYQVKPEDLDTYLAEQRRTRPNFDIYPPHGKDIYQPITFIEPVSINAEAVGLDMVHETNRHTSLNKARDTATAQITGPIVLVQDKSKTAGFLFFAPFYNGATPNSAPARQEAFGGAVYAPFVVNKLMSGVLDKDRRTTAIRITDGEQLIYDEITSDDADYDANTLATKRITIDLYGRTWVVDMRAGLEFRSDHTGIETTVILIVGLLLDSALLLLFFFLSRANRRGLRFADMATAALHSESNALKASVEDLKVARRQAESASEMKSVFLSTMSHEVRTPLTAISGILVLLERAKLTPSQNKLVQAGISASEKLMKLLTDVLDSSRLEAEAVELWEREVAVRPIVQDCQILAQGMIEKLGKDIVVAMDIAQDTPDAIFIDDIRLSQVLNNLMDNAIRFTDQGKITISTAAAHQDASAAVKISIADTGIGIAQSDLDVIFERFRQVDGSLTRERDGTGLGLAISHDLVTLMGGRLSVTSEEGVGTTFELLLPTGTEKLNGTINE